MRTQICIINDEFAYIVPIGDVHIGDRNANLKLLEENIKWVEATEQARVILMGDILNTATRTSKTNPHYQNLTLEEQIEEAIRLFTPIKNKIITAIDGNHEDKVADFAGFSPTISLCHGLGIHYSGLSSVIEVKVGKLKGKRQRYFFYCHHTTGGGSTVGGKMNRVDHLRRIISNVDVYCGAHNHQLGVVPVTTMEVDRGHDLKVRELRQLLVDCGGYLKWQDGYAEKKMYPPTKLGSPRIRLDGKKKDVHVSV